jgi:hypothetical protein
MKMADPAEYTVRDLALPAQSSPWRACAPTAPRTGVLARPLVLARYGLDWAGRADFRIVILHLPKP